MDMAAQHGDAAWIWNMDIDKQHEHEHEHAA
jgi:hypothetical protein